MLMAYACLSFGIATRRVFHGYVVAFAFGAAIPVAVALRFGTIDFVTFTVGLGLTITSCTARVLGGDVTAVSEPGVGSTFTLRVPLRIAAEPAQSEAPTISAEAA